MKLKLISTAAFGLLVFAILNFVYPGLMNFHEQNQLFLFTTDYFGERIATCGGLADYVSEFLVQFFYVPAYGAWIYAAALCAIQLLVYYNFRHNDNNLYFLSFIPSILLFLYSGNENLLFSFVVAMLFVLLYIKLSDFNTMLSLILLPLFYWCVGAMSVVNFLYVAYLLIRDRRYILLAAIPVVYVALAVCFAYIMPHQYPLHQVLLGINYYRIPGHYHFMMFFIPIFTLILIIISDKIKMNFGNKAALYVVQYTLVGASLLLSNVTYDQLKFRLINYDYLLRHRCYNIIIRQSEKHQPETDFELVCINLSLAQKGLLGERLFDYSQNGCAGLLSDAVLDNMSCMPSLEAYFNLGMINTALQFAFDTQESIMNNRKSGRLLKRMAECMIIDRKYEAARHYLLILSHSMFYSDWANHNLQIIQGDNDGALDPLYLTLRQHRFKENFIFYYPELAKMLGKLYIENRSNLLARQYCYAAVLLNKDLQTFVTFYQGLHEPATNLPKSYQQAWAMVWSGSHADFSGMPVEISNDTKHQLIDIAKYYMSDQNADNLRNKFGYNFWTYYFCNIDR